MSALPSNPQTHRHKRVRFAKDSSSSPTHSASDGSTLAPTDASTAASDYDTSSDTSMSDSSSDPSSESSSEDDESDEDEDTASESNLPDHTGRNGITSLRAGQGKKPTMRLDQDELGPDIRDFLKDFLPQLKKANEELEEQKRAGTLKGIDDEDGVEGETYIEMDLGLGVLEEKKDGEESDEDMDTEDGAKEKDVLGKLMGRPNTKAKEGAMVQEVEGVQQS